MKTPSVRKFIIRKLFGFKDVELSFEKNVQIFIGENGLGKTTVLNSLYYVLSQNFQKLSNINFFEIEIHFSKRKISFSKKDLELYLESIKDNKRSSFFEFLTKKLLKNEIADLKKIVENKNTDILNKRYDVHAYLKNKNININAPTAYVYDNVIRVIYEKDKSVDFNDIIDILNSEIKSKILYFPTYRRIEEELQNIGNYVSSRDVSRRKLFLPDDIITEDLQETEQNESDLIQFGMKDVEKRIKEITGQISRSSIIGFSKVTGDMLIQLLRGFPDLKDIEQNINIDNIKIILSRVGQNLSEDDKENIIELINSNKIFETENKQLIYFLEQLLELYKSQLNLDSAIKSFKDVCNGYLADKHYEYDESAVDLKIVREVDNDIKEEVLLNQLSSGEKQIVSLFSKIYLEPEQDFIVLFDEPELSLSIFWQKNLLPDILNSGKCEFLLAVTHSPFIFDNELKQYTIGLNEFISKSKQK